MEREGKERRKKEGDSRGGKAYSASTETNYLASQCQERGPSPLLRSCLDNSAAPTTRPTK